MGKENKSIFREKSLERIESPEKLDQYLRVTSPGIWALLISLIVFLLGVCYWGVFGNITSTVSTAVISTSEETYCLVPEGSLDAVIENRIIEIDGTEYSLQPGTIEPMVVSDKIDAYAKIAGNLKDGDIVYPVIVEKKLPKGIYTGDVVVERIHPMKLLIN